MSDDPTQREAEPRNRGGLAAYFRRIARALGRGEPIPDDGDAPASDDDGAEAEVTDADDESGEEPTPTADAADADDDTPGAEGEPVETDDESVETADDADDTDDTADVDDETEETDDAEEADEDGGEAEDETEDTDDDIEGSDEDAEDETESTDDDAEGADEDTTGAETGAATSKGTFELYADNAGKWRWRLVHTNGNIVADGGEGYADKRDAKSGIESVKSNAPDAHVIDTGNDEEPPEEGGSDAVFELFTDKADKYRWRLRHRNSNVIADCGQGYASKQKAKQGLTSVKSNAPGATVVDLSEAEDAEDEEE